MCLAERAWIFFLSKLSAARSFRKLGSSFYLSPLFNNSTDSIIGCRRCHENVFYYLSIKSFDWFVGVTKIFEPSFHRSIVCLRQLKRFHSFSLAVVSLSLSLCVCTSRLGRTQAHADTHTHGHLNALFCARFDKIYHLWATCTQPSLALQSTAKEKRQYNTIDIVEQL